MLDEPPSPTWRETVAPIVLIVVIVGVIIIAVQAIVQVGFALFVISLTIYTLLLLPGLVKRRQAAPIQRRRRRRRARPQRSIQYKRLDTPKADPFSTEQLKPDKVKQRDSDQSP